MAQTLTFDTAEVEAYADMLIDSTGVAPAEARKVVAKGALNIKTDARKRRSGSKHFPKLDRAIDYDTQDTPGGGWAEIGPNHDKPQGNLGHIPEDGALRTAPEPYMRPAAETELPKFEKAMEALALKPFA